MLAYIIESDIIEVGRKDKYIKECTTHSRKEINDMPNWCWNQTVFYGDKEKQKEIYETIYPNYLEKTWPHLDLLLRELGCTESELENDFCVRAHINDIRLLNNGELELCYESAWEPINEVIDEILALHQPQMKQVTLAEETGCDVFLNTDVEGKYFTEHYYLDLTITGEDESREEKYNDIKYYETLEGVIEELKNFFSFYAFDKLETEEDVERVIEDLRELEDVYITFGNYF